MNLEYAEIYILYNDNNYFESFTRNLFGIESYISEDSNVIIKCKNGEIIDYRMQTTANKIIASTYKNFIYIQNKLGKYYCTYKPPIIQDGIYRLNLSPYFMEDSSAHIKNGASYFTSLYECKGEFAFAIKKINSSDNYPRFYMSYNSAIIEREDIPNIIRHIFMKKGESDNLENREIVDTGDVFISNIS